MVSVCGYMDMKTQAKCKINLNDHIFSYAIVLNILNNDIDDEIS